MSLKKRFRELSWMVLNRAADEAERYQVFYNAEQLWRQACRITPLSINRNFARAKADACLKKTGRPAGGDRGVNYYIARVSRIRPVDEDDDP